MKIQVGKKELSEKQKKILRKVKVILQYVFIFLSLLIATTVAWVFRTWKGLTMEEVVFHIQAPTTGTDSGIISSFILTCPLISIVLTLVILLLHKRLGKIKDIAVLGLMVAFLAVAAFSVGYMWNRLDITAYAKNQTTESTFIEDNYADPKEVELTFPSIPDKYKSGFVSAPGMSSWRAPDLRSCLPQLCCRYSDYSDNF